MSRIVAIDVETAQPYDHVVEIGACEIVDGAVGSRTFLRRIRPASAMSPHCQAVHGISLHDLRDAPSFADILPDLIAFVGASPLLAHNRAYEVNTLSKEFARLGLSPWERDRFACTMAMARRSGVPASLRGGCESLGIGTAHLGSRHDALNDALLCARFYVALSAGAAALREAPVREVSGPSPW